MKNLITGILVVAFAALLISAVTTEDQFVIPIVNWTGLSTGDDVSYGQWETNDMMNMEIGLSGNRRILKQRRPFRKTVMETMPRNTNSITLCQIDGDTERVVVSMDNGDFYYNTGYHDAGVFTDTAWHLLTTGTDEHTKQNSTFVLFKDTLLGGGLDSIFSFAPTSGEPGFITVARKPFPYNRILLHQDRIYGYSTDDSLNTKIVWMPIFDITNFSDAVDTLTGAGFAYIDRDDGDFLTNVVPMGRHLIAYKSRSIYKIIISPSTNAPSEVARVTDNLGAYGYGAVTSWNGLHFFVGEEGVYRYDGNTATKISDPLNNWFADSITESTGGAQIFKIAVVENRLYVTLPIRKVQSPSSVDNYRTFVYDFTLKEWWKYRLSYFASGTAVKGQHDMFRYEHSDNASVPLWGPGKRFGQYLVFVTNEGKDVTGSGRFDVLHRFPADSDIDGDNGTLINGSYTSTLSAFGTMSKRKALNRLVAYSTAEVSSDSMSYVVHFFGADGSELDSTDWITVTSNGSTLHNIRLSDKVTDDLIGYRINIQDSGALSIHMMEMVGSVRGMADETE